MPSVRGHFNGSVVVLDEPVSMEVATEVLVEYARPTSPGFGEPPAPGLPPLPTADEWRQRMELLSQVFEEWKSDESGYDEETWPALKASLERNREEAGEYRKLFRE